MLAVFNQSIIDTAASRASGARQPAYQASPLKFNISREQYIARPLRHIRILQTDPDLLGSPSKRQQSTAAAASPPSYNYVCVNKSRIIHKMDDAGKQLIEMGRRWWKSTRNGICRVIEPSLIYQDRWAASSPRRHRHQVNSTWHIKTINGCDADADDDERSLDLH